MDGHLHRWLVFSMLSELTILSFSINGTQSLDYVLSMGCSKPWIKDNQRIWTSGFSSQTIYQPKFQRKIRPLFVGCVPPRHRLGRSSVNVGSNDRMICPTLPNSWSAPYCGEIDRGACKARVFAATSCGLGWPWLTMADLWRNISSEKLRSHRTPWMFDRQNWTTSGNQNHTPSQDDQCFSRSRTILFRAPPRPGWTGQDLAPWSSGYHSKPTAWHGETSLDLGLLSESSTHSLVLTEKYTCASLGATDDRFLTSFSPWLWVNSFSWWTCQPQDQLLRSNSFFVVIPTCLAQAQWHDQSYSSAQKHDRACNAGFLRLKPNIIGICFLLDLCAAWGLKQGP